MRIANFLIREIIRRDVVDHDFVSKHCVFSTGPTDIGYGSGTPNKWSRPAERDTLERQLRVKLDRWEAAAQGRR